MGKKGKKTRWRRLPIGGTDEEGGLSLDGAPPTTDPNRITFNEDEYTKITTPRQDVLFKKGYFGRKRNPNPSPSDTQEVHSGDSVESESFVSEEPQYVYPTGYMDPSGVYYVNGNTFETYDPYTGTVTVVVGPPAQYPGGAPVLAAVPCQPVPLQSVEWFNPPNPWCYSYNRRKRYSTDSQNCSAQSSESTGPPGSPQEPVDEGACAMYPPQYVYPGYMFGPPIYNMNGVTVQGVIPQPVPIQPDLSMSKRRKKRRRRRRGGVTDDGSESSCCEEPLLTCDVPGCQSETSSDAVCQSGASSDAGAGPGSISSKANSDSGINTDPTPNSGSNSPPLQDVQFDPSLAQSSEKVISNISFNSPQLAEEDQSSDNQSDKDDQLSVSCDLQDSQVLSLCYKKNNTSECVIKDEERSQGEVTTPEEFSEELSTAEDDVTPNLCVAASEFSSQESTLSCLSTPSVTRDLILNEHEISNNDITQEELFETTETIACIEEHTVCEVTSCDDKNCISLPSIYPGVEVRTKDLIPSFEEVIENTKTVNNDIENVSEYSHKEARSNKMYSIVNETKPFDINETNINCKVDQIPEIICIQNEEVQEIIIEQDCIASTSTDIDVASSSNSHSCIKFPPDRETIAPVPPPRRKRSMCRAADRLASRVVEDAIKEGVEEAASIRLRSPISITEAVTRWLNSQGSLSLTYPVMDSESDDDEGIEIGEGLTDQKNVLGNPFLVPSHSGSGKRVAKDCESIESSAGEWDLWDSSHTRDMCDPTRSVDKYYRLGADDGVGDKVPPSVYKTAMHIRHSGPFPCGVCCIIQ